MKRSRELEGNGRDADKQEKGKGMDYWGVSWTLMGRDNPPPPEKQGLCSQAKPIGNKKALTLCSTAFVKAKKQVV